MDFWYSLYKQPSTRKDYDKVELWQAKANPKYLSYLKEIPEVDNFSKLHNRIVKEFPDIRLLGEIEINDVEYNPLCIYFRKKYLQISRNIGRSVVDIMFSIA